MPSIDDEQEVLDHALAWLAVLAAELQRCRHWYGRYGEQILAEIEPLRRRAEAFAGRTIAVRRLRVLSNETQLPLPFRPALADARALLEYLRDWYGAHL